MPKINKDCSLIRIGMRIVFHIKNEAIIGIIIVIDYKFFHSSI